MPTQPTWVTSRYNFSVVTDKGLALFNARTGAGILVDGEDGHAVAQKLCRYPSELSETHFTQELSSLLQDGGFMCEEDFDELQAIRDVYWQARSGPVVLTITATLDCNLGCYYCYQERGQSKLKVGDVDEIVRIAREKIASANKRSLHIDWYGGEPLLNPELIEAASIALQELCLSQQVTYSASIITNGTLWPADPGGFVARHRIRQVQITFDGMKKNHDKRRRYRSTAIKESSFEVAASLVDRLLDCVRVDLRLNLDRGNAADMKRFVEFARARGWFNKRFPAIVQPARVSSFSEKSGFMRKHEFSLQEFDALRGELRATTRGIARVEESESPDGEAAPRNSVCAALNSNAVVIGPEGNLYRCGLQVSEPHRSTGNMSRSSLPILQQTASEQWWDRFDPTRLASCSRCSFLPLCWGGCPKRHLEGDDTALHEQSVYWRENLSRLICNRLSVQPLGAQGFTEKDQFRTSGN